MEVEGIPHIYLSFWKDLMNLSVTDSDVQKCFYTYKQTKTHVKVLQVL